MIKALLAITLLVSMTSHAARVTKATCDQGKILFDTETEDYSMLEEDGSYLIILGDEGRTKVYQDDSEGLHVKNSEILVRPPIDPDGNVHLPWAKNTVEILIDKETGEGEILYSEEGYERNTVLTNCK
ncbi:hypothetical protein HBN50_13785 [Halobacteriovorax sp. GB3]|uniref:hypothetical protein n=1 Tax=Halobacteriovorax sp. GB3 TaxID=2719615 RepID=UPI002362320D|nr:hypothetical protein [Halobacteriovorax sp. GB3]MDD0854179.1 hypothetical protein [Halobacteriovorax sp. GB3]